jgi:hypothetical protein
VVSPTTRSHTRRPSQSVSRTRQTTRASLYRVPTVPSPARPTARLSSYLDCYSHPCQPQDSSHLLQHSVNSCSYPVTPPQQLPCSHLCQPLQLPLSPHSSHSLQLLPCQPCRLPPLVSSQKHFCSQTVANSLQLLLVTPSMTVVVTPTAVAAPAVVTLSLVVLPLQQPPRPLQLPPQPPRLPQPPPAHLDRHTLVNPCSYTPVTPHSSSHPHSNLPDPRSSCHPHSSRRHAGRRL